MIAFVFFVITKDLGSRHKVSGCISAKVTSMPFHSPTMASDTKVMGVVINSPPLMLYTFRHKSRAEVPEFVATQYFTPTYSANFFSNSKVFGPNPHQPESSTFKSSLLVLLSIVGFNTGIILYI